MVIQTRMFSLYDNCGRAAAVNMSGLTLDSVVDPRISVPSGCLTFFLERCGQNVAAIGSASSEPSVSPESDLSSFCARLRLAATVVSLAYLYLSPGWRFLRVPEAGLQSRQFAISNPIISRPEHTRQCYFPPQSQVLACER